MTSKALLPAFAVGALALLALAGACAQIEGLNAFENVSCVGDACGGGDGARGPLTCGPNTTDCGEPACVDLRTTANHCGACGTACQDQKTCCAMSCVDSTTDVLNCGACGNACADKQVCVAGHCGPPDAGVVVPQGAPLVAAGTTTINAVRTGGAAGAAGQPVVGVASTAGFLIGDIVIIHQTRGTNAGVYEAQKVAAVSPLTLTLAANLAQTYVTGGADAAQVARVDHYASIAVPAGAKLTAPAWDGASGGILAVVSASTVTVAGTVDMSGAGFRGTNHASSCAAGTAFRCTAPPNPSTAGVPANGGTGESSTGPSVVNYTNNGSGGGGGQSGHCGSAGGGGYGTAGESIADVPVGDSAPCQVTVQHGGVGGVAVGTPDLTTSLLFGGAGGEGGGNDTGAYPGGGGNGGGIILLVADILTVTGEILANGIGGDRSVANAAVCGGSGCGMGPGGGGAGGAIYFSTTTGAQIGTGLVVAVGGSGAICDCGDGDHAGAGGDGRIYAGGAGTVTGTTKPAFAVAPPPGD